MPRKTSVALILLLASCTSGGDSPTARPPTSSSPEATAPSEPASPSPAPSAKPSRPKPHPYVPKEGFPEGAARIVDVRTFVRFDELFLLQDLSSDGALVAFLECVPVPNEYECAKIRVGALDLVHDTARFLAIARNTGSGAVFSPDSRRILFQDEHDLRTVDVATGLIDTVAGGANVTTALFWLSDGRIAYLAADRRLMFVRPGDPPAAAGLTIENPPGYDDLESAFAISPDGTHVLYAHDCHSWLRDLATGEELDLGKGLAVPQNAWSPDGSRFVLQLGTWNPRHCANWGANPTYEMLFRADGTRSGRVTGDEFSGTHGHVVVWSNDGRWLLITHNPTGTETFGLDLLIAVSIEDRSLAEPFDLGGIVGPAFVGPGGWIVFPRFDHPGTGSSNGDERGAVLVGRLLRG